MLPKQKPLSAVPALRWEPSSGFASKVNVSPLVSQIFAGEPELLEQVTLDNKTGFARMLPAGPLNGQTAIKFDGNYRAHARRFLETKQVSELLGTNLTHLKDGDVEEVLWGGRIPVRQVHFTQMHPLQDGTDVPVNNAMVTVTMKEDGEILHVTNGIELGTAPRKLGKVKGTDKAVAKAKRTVGADKCTAACELRLSEHNGKFNLIYVVTVSCKELCRVVYLDARTLKVLFNKNLRHYSIVSEEQQAGLNRVPAKTFLRIPDPNTEAFKQARDYYIEDLPDPTVLENDILTPYVRNASGEWEKVHAKADGTFNFDPESTDAVERSKFNAVYAFICETHQDRYYEKHGGKKARRIDVYIDDPDTVDNAYFSPSEWKESIGRGSGLSSGGLNTEIGRDGGVLWHESGHKRDAVQIPGGPRGPWGNAAGEGRAGDVDGQVVNQIRWRILFQQLDGTPVLTAGELKSWPGIIGSYALPPNGIRKQKNKRQYPASGRPTEVHDDGEIIGGACYDLLVSFLTDGKTDAEAVSMSDLDRFIELELAASTLLPSRSQTFKDILVAQRTADKTLTGGKDRQRIDKAHAGHGINDNMKIDADPVDDELGIVRRPHPVTK